MAFIRIEGAGLTSYNLCMFLFFSENIWLRRRDPYRRRRLNLGRYQQKNPKRSRFTVPIQQPFHSVVEGVVVRFNDAVSTWCLHFVQVVVFSVKISGLWRGHPYRRRRFDLVTIFACCFFSENFWSQ